MDLLKCTARNFLKHWIDLPLEKLIETTDRLPKMQGQKFVEATVTFFM